MPEELSERDALIIYPGGECIPRPGRPSRLSVRQYWRPDGAQPLPVPPLPLPLPPPLSSLVDVVEFVVVELVVVDVVGFVVVVGVVVVGLVVGVGAGAWVWVTVVVPPPHAAIPVPAPTPRATAVAMLASRFITLLSSVLMVRSSSSETGWCRSLVFRSGAD